MHYTSREVYEFISKQMNDPIVERKTCTISGQPFAIFQSDLDFYAKISPTFNGQKFQIPTPTLCPEERQRRRLSFRNERKLYRRQCDASKKSIISIYSPDKPYKVYDQKIRRSDSRDPMDYGMDFDFSKTFTENFDRLMKEVPRPNLLITSCENCDYTNHSYYNKNCYLLFGAVFNENCLFSDQMANSLDCFDCRVGEKMIQCYYCLSCANCTQLFYSISCTNCNFSYGLYDCKNCEFCINSSGLLNKKYYINNEQKTKEEYDIYMKSLHFTIPHILLSQRVIGSENSIGDEIHGSKSCIGCFDIYNCNHCKYIRSDMDATDAMDSYGISKSPLSIECLAVKDLHKGLGSFMCIGGTQIYYSHFCYDSSNLFGCIGLRNKSYCIFNKQYTKEEYEIQVAKIIAHMQTTGERGEFFHPSLSPFGYNETVAQEYYYTSSPSLLLSEKGDHKDVSPSLSGEGFGVRFDDLKIFGYKRSTYNADPSLPTGVQTIEKKNYTDEQRDALLSQDNLETQVFLCSVSSRPYRLQKAEIEFYRKHHLPIPDKHPDIRHEERMKLRPGRTLFLRNCDCCNKEMLSVYPQDHKGKVYCESCYQQEVYS